MSIVPYPWQQSAWQHFLQQVANDRLPHALLLVGQRGIGKWHYAQAMANFLLCPTPRSGLACGECRSCLLSQAQTHPDKQEIQPEDSGKLIKIDQIRQLSHFITQTAQQGGRKIAMIGPIEQLNINAANALLKSLEEPSGDTLLILFSHVPSGVLATIRSRCQIVTMKTPERATAIHGSQEGGQGEHAISLLKGAAGAPGLAKQLLENNALEQLDSFFQVLLQVQQPTQGSAPLHAIQPWLDIAIMDLLDWWLQLVSRLLYKPSSDNDSDQASATPFARAMAEIESLAGALNPQWLFRFVDKLLSLKKQVLQGANPNKQLLLEELLIDWYAIVCPQHRIG